MAAETGFQIDGEHCPLVILDDFDTDERYILYEYAEVVQEDFLREEDETEGDCARRRVKLMRRPGFWPAMWHVAYQRLHPDVSKADIRAIIGRTKFSVAMTPMADWDDVDELDPTKASTSEPDESSRTSSDASNESSGIPSESDTAARVVHLAPTTVGNSQPSESIRETSAF